jgi:uncharacterized protein
MRCPACGSRLVEIDRSEVHIDACPQCRGVWLDRGELDRLLEYERRSMVGRGTEDEHDEDFFAEMEGSRRRDSPRRSRDDDDDDRGKSKKRKRRGMLEDLFDF